jgi:hypothetical protein
VQQSGDEGLTGTIDDGLERRFTGVLLRVQAFAASGDAVLIDQREAEAAVAGRHDQAVERGESVGQRTDSVLRMKCVSHVMGVPAIYAA